VELLDVLHDWLPPAIIFGGLTISTTAAWLMRQHRRR
jgi:hypothetical protein